MKKRLYISILSTIFVLGLSIHSNAQGIKFRDFWRNTLRNEKFSITGNLGLSTYFGDVCTGTDCMQFRPNLGIGAIYRFHDNFSVKTDLNYFRLYSDDTWERRNLGFRSDNLEVYSSLMYDIFPWERQFRRRHRISPYLFAGIGVAFYNPQAQLDGRWHNLRPMETEGVRYGIATPIIPFGGGVRYVHSKSLEFMLEAGYRITFTDYLDDVSGTRFRDPSEIQDRTARSLSNRATIDNFRGQRGNPDRNDGYFLLQAKVRYTFVRNLSHYSTRPPGLRRKL
ncbi:MAG: DUF6089 family protein [Cytophagaceae bacterium]